MDINNTADAVVEPSGNRGDVTRYAVVLPVGPATIKNTTDTIESILFHSGRNVTLFVVDDCTEDGTTSD